MSKKPTQLTLESLRKLSGPSVSLSDIPEVTQLAEQTHCLCCNLAISEIMIRNSEKRAQRSGRKPVHQIQQGIFKDRLLCKQCVMPANVMALLTLKDDNPDKLLTLYRSAVADRYLLLLSQGNPEQRKLAVQALEKLHFGEWRGHMRMPDFASHFWVLGSILKQMSKDE